MFSQTYHHTATCRRDTRRCSKGSSASYRHLIRGTMLTTFQISPMFGASIHFSGPPSIVQRLSPLVSASIDFQCLNPCFYVSVHLSMLQSIVRCICPFFSPSVYSNVQCFSPFFSASVHSSMPLTSYLRPHRPHTSHLRPHTSHLTPGTWNPGLCLGS